MQFVVIAVSLVIPVTIAYLVYILLKLLFLKFRSVETVRFREQSRFALGIFFSFLSLNAYIFGKGIFEYFARYTAMIDAWSEYWEFVLTYGFFGLPFIFLAFTFVGVQLLNVVMSKFGLSIPLVFLVASVWAIIAYLVGGGVVAQHLCRRGWTMCELSAFLEMLMPSLIVHFGYFFGRYGFRWRSSEG